MAHSESRPSTLDGRTIPGIVISVLCIFPAALADDAEVPSELQPWLATTQDWRRDTDGPVIALGSEGEFDDTHIFAPAVIHEDGDYRLWYCGSTGRVAERVFQLGLYNSDDGRIFQRHSPDPVYSFGDGRHSVLTPTLLRRPDGSVMREDGRLRMWFSATDFAGGSGLHTLHETHSHDGIEWDAPSAALLSHVYAPTIIREDNGYRMWYTNVGLDPWVISHASSADGRDWTVTEAPVLVVDQVWEQQRLFYPTVLQIDGVYLMWYGSYWSAEANKTALGFAVSADGLTWHKHPANPVFQPDPARSWESHYTTSQSVLRMPDGSFRIWYASRKAPPFVNKYFAIGTATWGGQHVGEPDGE